MRIYNKSFILNYENNDFNIYWKIIFSYIKLVKQKKKINIGKKY